jgi:hypothetical protein
MAQRIDEASKYQFNLEYEPETMRLAKDINQATEMLSIYLTKMVDDLDSFVSVLEGVQVAAKKERSLAEQFLKWLIHSGAHIAEQVATVFQRDSGAFLEYVIFSLQGQK